MYIEELIGLLQTAQRNGAKVVNVWHQYDYMFGCWSEVAHVQHNAGEEAARVGYAGQNMAQKDD